MNEQDAIQEYARITFALKQARIQCLEKMGITEDGLRELEDNAVALMGSEDIVGTDYGKVQKRYNKPVQYTQHRLSKAGDIIEKKEWKYKLQLITERT